MVTTIRKVTGGDHPFYEFACLSTDTKPTSLVPENSICHEIDTGKHFYFGNGEWHQLPARGGGEGLPDNFPAEGAENANKFLGFDANGDYTAKGAPAGGGVSSWNDLTDRPFYEEDLPAIDLEIPSGGSYVEGSVSASEDGVSFTAPLKFYRAGNLYTPEQLTGATATLVADSDTDTSNITSNSFIEVEQNEAVIGYLILYNTIIGFLALNDDTVLNTEVSIDDSTVSVTSGTLSSGSYLLEMDMSGVGGDQVTCTSITRDATTVVHKLDSKFVTAELPQDFPQATQANAGKYVGVDSNGAFSLMKPVMYVNITGDPSNGYTADKSLSEIKEAISSGATVFAVFDGSRVPLTYFAESRVGFSGFETENSSTALNAYVIYITSETVEVHTYIVAVTQA